MQDLHWMHKVPGTVQSFKRGSQLHCPDLIPYNDHTRSLQQRGNLRSTSQGDTYQPGPKLRKHSASLSTSPRRYEIRKHLQSGAIKRSSPSDLRLCSSMVDERSSIRREAAHGTPDVLVDLHHLLDARGLLQTITAGSAQRVARAQTFPMTLLQTRKQPSAQPRNNDDCRQKTAQGNWTSNSMPEKTCFASQGDAN